MENFKPLIEQAAFWVHIDALLRVFWSIFGASAAIVACVLLALLARRLLEVFKP